jgi:hypothetical protein
VHDLHNQGANQNCPKIHVRYDERYRANDTDLNQQVDVAQKTITADKKGFSD